MEIVNANRIRVSTNGSGSSLNLLTALVDEGWITRDHYTPPVCTYYFTLDGFRQSVEFHINATATNSSFEFVNYSANKAKVLRFIRRHSGVGAPKEILNRGSNWWALWR